MVRRHPEHVSFLGDAVAHTKLVTQKLEAQVVAQEDKIELEKRRNVERAEKSEQLRIETQREMEEKQREIQEAERKRHEAELSHLQAQFKREISVLKNNEEHYQQKIAELECKTTYAEKK